MLPLRPPPRPVAPGYPTRSGLLGDSRLRRQALGVLAAAVLTGCAGEPVPPPLSTGGTPPPSVPLPEPRAVPGESSAPQPVPIPLGGAPRPPAPPEQAVPKPLGGLVAPQPQPEPTALRGDVAPVQQPEPAPLRGRTVVQPTPPEPLKP